MDGASQNLAQPTRLFHDVFNASPIGIAVENLDGQPLFVNPAFCSMLGFSEEELRSKHCVDFSPSEDAEKDWVLFRQLRAGLIDHYQLDKRYFRKDGSLVWGRLSLSLLKGDHAPLVIAMVEDITDKKVAEEALRASEERLRLAQQVARIGTFERDVRTERITWAEGLEPLYGLPPGSLHGKALPFFKDLLHPADWERANHLIQQALKSGQTTEGEWRAIWPDGSVHWIVSRWKALMDDSGEPTRVIGVNMDVTERKRTEEALFDLNRMLEAKTASLQSSEELLKIFVKHVPAAVAMFDREMRYLQVSDRWCADYSVEGSKILGRSHYAVFPEIPERWKEAHRRGLEGETVRAEDDRWDRQGRSTWERWEIRPWRNGDELPGGILIFTEDITRRKEMEEHLSAMSRKLIESQEQERARIGRELHDDINQRLAMLSLDLEQLGENPSEVLSRSRYLRKEMAEISNDVQALSHDLHSSKLEYLGVVAGIKSWCKEFAARNKIEVDCEASVQSILPLDIGRALFRVLQEALHNASKYSGVRRVEVQLQEEINSIHLIVNDLGKGFEVEPALQGKGLGLTSMQERVRLLNGTIEIQSKPMSGTRIHVRVPFGSEHVHRQAVG